MANPFGSNDEALSKNTNHTNQANLIYAVIPRSASKVVEVINSQSITGLTGDYDADGYWDPNSTTRVSVEFTPTGITTGSTKTIITGWFRDSGAGEGDIGSTAGFRNSLTQVAYSQTVVPPSGFDAYSRSRDHNYQDGPSGATGVTTHTAFAFAHAHNSVGPAQKGWKRVSGSNTALTGTTFTYGTGTNEQFDKVGFQTTSRFRFQYLFVYNSYLSDADINAIIDDPGAVLTYGGAGQPSGKRLGGVPFATLNRGVW